MTTAKIETAGARAALATLLERITDGATRAVENAAAAAEKAARATTSFKDGPRDGKHQNLRDSIEHSNVGPYHARIRAMARHALWVEEDTKPHTITARRVPFLVFKVNGHWVRRKSVKHPGTKGTHFMRDAALSVEPILRDNIERLTETAIRRHNR